MNTLLINIYYDDILSTITDVNYIINLTCTIYIPININFGDLKKQVHTGLNMFPNQYKFTIKARINIAQLSSGAYYHSLCRVFFGGYMGC
jgi:hypothetical protein